VVSISATLELAAPSLKAARGRADAVAARGRQLGVTTEYVRAPPGHLPRNTRRSGCATALTRNIGGRNSVLCFFCTGRGGDSAVCSAPPSRDGVAIDHVARAAPVCDSRAGRSSGRCAVPGAAGERNDPWLLGYQHCRKTSPPLPHLWHPGVPNYRIAPLDAEFNPRPIRANEATWLLPRLSQAAANNRGGRPGKKKGQD